jgi:hypothetical protein
MEGIEKFARKDSVTGKGMNDGYCFGDGDFYCVSGLDALQKCEELGYKTMEEAFEDEAYYWTTWEAEEEETYFDENGYEWLNPNDELFIKVFNKAKTEILADIENGTLPKTVKSYYEMNDFVDANCYGGFCEEDYISSKNFEFERKVQEAVEEWLKTR